MSSVKITIELPEDLAERVKTGDSLSDASQILTLIKAELARAQAAAYLLDAASQLQLLPDDEKPSMDEINDIVHEVRAEITKQKQTDR